MSTFVFFLVASPSLFWSPFKHLLYFHLFFSPFLSLLLCISLSSTLFPSISLFVPMSIYFSQSFYFYLLMSLFPYVTLSITISSTVTHSLFLHVSLTSINSIFPSLFAYTTLLFPYHVHSPSTFVFSFSFLFLVNFWFFFVVRVVICC
jgi:hypothetical protein